MKTIFLNQTPLSMNASAHSMATYENARVHTPTPSTASTLVMGTQGRGASPKVFLYFFLLFLLFASAAVGDYVDIVEFENRKSFIVARKHTSAQ